MADPYIRQLAREALAQSAVNPTSAFNRSVLGAQQLQRPTQQMQQPAEPYLRQQYPEIYGGLAGLMGMAPDELAGSVLDPNTARARAGAQIGFPIGTALQVSPMVGPAARAAAAGARELGPTAVRMGEGYLQSKGLMPQLDVYHGSPYKFDRFDASKIGAGEGAQVYGHGLYFAENPVVAKNYQTALAGKDGTATGHAAQVVNVYGGDYEKALKHLKSIQPAPGETTFSGESHELIRDAIKAIQSGAYKSADKGSLYKVDLPDEQIAKMLDWDKPLSQQPNAVKALRSIADRVPGLSDALQPFELGSTTGRTVNDYISRALSPEDAARLFKDAGIPGIKYLDEGSRNLANTWIVRHPQGGENVFSSKASAEAYLKRNPEETLIEPKVTRNFVVFPGNESMLTIMERNNQPVQQAMQEFEQGLANFMATR